MTRSIVLTTAVLFLCSPQPHFRSVISFQQSYQSYRNSIVRTQDTNLHNYRGNKFVSPVMEDRLKRGLLTSADLDRCGMNVNISIIHMQSF